MTNTAVEIRNLTKVFDGFLIFAGTDTGLGTVNDMLQFNDFMLAL